MSSNRKKLTLVLEALDKYSKPFQDAASATRGYSKIAQKVAAQQRTINRTIGDIKAYDRLQSELKETGSEMQKAGRKSAELANKIAKTEKPTAALKREFSQAQREEARLNKQHDRQSYNLNKLQKELTEAKVDTNDLTGATKRLESQQASLNRKMKFGKFVDKTKDGIKSVAGFAKRMAVRGTIAGGALGYLFKREFIDTASQFEKFETVLKTLEGSTEKARKSMAWIQQFGATTPYEIDGVTESFVRLKAYGIDPMDGTLQTLGDTAAAMDKPIMQAVEAIADAITGENERLKEFGIKAAKGGGQITYEYVNKAGKQMSATVDASNRKMIQSTLMAIWNEKYKGAMNDLSSTWGGMLSNISDQWTNFKILVMKQGLFDKMKSKLEGLLNKINEMAASGELEKKAKAFGDSLIVGFDKAVSAAKTIMDLVEKALALIDKINNGINSVRAFFSDGPEDKYELSSTKRRRSRDTVKNSLLSSQPKLKVVEPDGSLRSGRSKVNNVATTNNITINAAPGMDETALANKTADEIERRNNRGRNRRAYD